MKNKLLFSLSLAASIAVNATSSEVERLDSIEVNDTAFQEQIKSITALTLENQQASDVKDILKSMPSVIVDGNSRYAQKVYIRGLEDKFSNISVDGAQ